MLKPEDISSIRDYYLNLHTNANRQAFALSLNNDILFEFIRSLDKLFFGSFSSIDEELDKLLNNFNFQDNKNSICELQEEFYLDVATRYLNNQIDDDVTRLMSSGNILFKEILDQEKTFSREIKSAFFLSEKEKLKQRFQELEKIKSNTVNTAKNKKRLYVSAISIAAAACLVLFIWQPFRIGNEQLFSNYLASASTALPVVSRIDFVDKANGSQTRSENENTVKGFTYEESKLIFSSFTLMENGDFLTAKLNLLKASVSKEKSPEILIYLAIAQLNTNETEKAIENLEFLNNLPNYPFSEEVKYHLAMACLKEKRNKEARTLLHQLVKEQKRYSNESEKLLKQMRLF